MEYGRGGISINAVVFQASQSSQSSQEPEVQKMGRKGREEEKKVRIF